MAHTVVGRWEPDVRGGLPRAYWRPCRYEAYVPDPVSHLNVSLPLAVVADASDAERQVARLNTTEHRAASLEAVARLLWSVTRIAYARLSRFTG